MALPKRFTKTDGTALLGISYVTFDKRCREGVYTWPPKSWADLHQEDVEFQKGGNAVDDDRRFRAARADLHEIEAFKERGEWASVESFEEQIVGMFGAFMQEAEGAEARMSRSAPSFMEMIRSEFRAMREGLSRGVERYCESLEERSRRGTAKPAKARRRVGVNGADTAAGERGAGAV